MRPYLVAAALVLLASVGAAPATAVPLPPEAATARHKGWTWHPAPPEASTSPWRVKAATPRQVKTTAGVRPGKTVRVYRVAR